MLITLSLLLVAPSFADSTTVTVTSARSECIGRRMDCYMDAYNVCGSGGFKGDTAGCQSKILRSCDRDFRCDGDAVVPEKPLNPGYKIHARVQYEESCAPYKAMLEQRINAAVERFQDCLNYAFVKEDLAKRMVAVLESSYAVRLRCIEPPRSTWCAAGGMGEIQMSPSRMLNAGSFCNADLGSYFIHEMAHVANLSAGPDHNELGETGAPDEVYSLQNYCMRPARMWLQRAKRSVDVVDSEHLTCMRDYQEFTPSTLRDPFWDEYRKRMDKGEDPCPASMDPSLNEKPRAARRGD